ncbi:CocE/NonD family hydrolase [Nocardioides sp. JQ2195]|uniref:CocE/NonD family hydrolase n=1 Tax=Nocardioides sp. JQ2195 TaxID=2592334 RepID=UPI00143E363E|nr:CocE/NonD family hydrolase [Nocardioides sp. JQ2195]QIX25351.1 CocE/NonD family hydrolase [Nocardioides sp. JQ2195]
MDTRRSTPLVAALAGLALVVAGALSPATAAGSPVTAVRPSDSGIVTSAPVSAADGTWTPRGEDHPQTTTVKDVAIPMSDGVSLRGDLMLPADSAGNAIDEKVPVVVTITAYNKTLQTYAGGLAGGDASYLVKRGYAHLTVDARGTGSSEGEWQAFSARENKDAGEVMTWAHEQEWSDGSTAMTGPSYMGISQIWAGSAQPPGLKALFPQVPGADVYRDVVASGGQVDVGFIPLWLGLVTSLGVVPPTITADDPAAGLGTLLSHLGSLLTFTTPLLLNAVLGQEPAYDGEFYQERSPINVVDRVEVPTFFIAGEYDLFQRGTPLLFENLQQRGVPTKMIIGPWDHLQGSSGEDVDQAGHGELAELQLRWFDHYVKGMADPTLDSEIAPLTYFEQGSGDWRTSQEWIGPQLQATSYRLSGSATTGVRNGSLTTGKVADGTADVLPIPVAGLCTRSMNQWTAGLPSSTGLANPCLENNALNDRAGVVFETAPVTEPVSIQGPINARLHVSSTSGDGMLSVAVEDVAPDGTVSRLTGGWQVISLRELDESRSRHLDGKLIQPFHPYTSESKRPLERGEVAPVDVEVFPTGAQIRKGHRLRLAVQAFDVPHLLPTLPDVLGTLTVIRIHNSARYPSELTLPTLAH